MAQANNNGNNNPHYPRSSKESKGIAQSRPKTFFGESGLLRLQEIRTLALGLPSTCQVGFAGISVRKFFLTVRPNAGLWEGGVFTFSILIPDNYNSFPPMVKCQTGIWHPNISKDGEVGLAMLDKFRPDNGGWHTGRSLKDVALGLNEMFLNWVSFHTDHPQLSQIVDVKNKLAAAQYKICPQTFQVYARILIRAHCENANQVLGF